MKAKIPGIFTENLSYKVVSLMISLILCLTILGRRDFNLSKNIEVEILPGRDQSIISQTVENIKVKVSGPRTALKKFMDSGLSQMVSIDVSELAEGEYELPIPINKIDVPFGVKVVSVKPSTVKVYIKKKNH